MQNECEGRIFRFTTISSARYFWSIYEFEKLNWGKIFRHFFFFSFCAPSTIVRSVNICWTFACGGLVLLMLERYDNQKKKMEKTTIRPKEIRIRTQNTKGPATEFRWDARHRMRECILRLNDANKNRRNVSFRRKTIISRINNWKYLPQLVFAWIVFQLNGRFRRNEWVYFKCRLQHSILDIYSSHFCATQVHRYIANIERSEEERKIRAQFSISIT